MARSDLLIKLVRFGSQGDQTGFRRAAEALIAEERKKRHHVLADRLTENLRPNGFERKAMATDERTQSLFFQIAPQKQFDDLILPKVVRQACLELVEEQTRGDLLRASGLEPRHRVLLAGPPGNGKTSVAEAIAESLAVPMVSVRYEGLIGSFLGETAARLRRVFDYVRTHPCVLFFDEFDTIGKERGDTHETGEIKRVVSSLLLQVDALPSYVVVVTASNHPELLDRAVWRRFQLRLRLPAPQPKQLEEWFRAFEARTALVLGYAPAAIAKKLSGISFAEAEDFCTDILRRHVLSHGEKSVKQIVSDRLSQWEARFSTE